MKKLYIILFLILLPHCTFADMEVFLSSQKLPYAYDVWTSGSYPDPGSSNILVEPSFYREDMPFGYRKTQTEVKELIEDLFPTLSSTERFERYTSFMAFQKQNLDQYIAFALSPTSSTDISDKQTAGFVLSPFERTFQNCGIDLSQRKAIISTLLTNIFTGSYTSISQMRYSDIRFGDCIIPFPDARRGANAPVDAFFSNKTLVQFLSGNPPRFGSGENGVNLISLSEVTLSGSYTQLQENDLLNLTSTRIEAVQSFAKQIGKNKILFIHQNHTISPFVDTLITGNTSIGYTIAGSGFTLSHPLFIRTTDTAEKRTLGRWEEIVPGIYKKTVVQENTFTQSGSIYIPKQTVAATTYYAVIYNYDNTSPVCENTFFSHDSLGNENFIFPEYPWFRKMKYGYFLCGEDVSQCQCDSSISDCFVKEDQVLSTPLEIPHAGVSQYQFYNLAGLSQTCNSVNTQKIFYDKTPADIRILIPSVPESTFIKEYVSNNGVLYNAVQVQDKNFYHINNSLSFEADAGIDMKLEFLDVYNPSNTDEGVSGLSTYDVGISKLENGNWNLKVQDQRTFSPYNSGGLLRSTHRYMLDLQTLTGSVQDVFTKQGDYQVFVSLQDAAGNESRVIYYFTIVAGDIDIGRSTLETSGRTTLFADNASYYRYTLLLKDRYGNPVSGREVGTINQSCGSILGCKFIRTNMTGITPVGSQALHVYDFSPISSRTGSVVFSVKSLAPGVFTERFQLNFLNPGASFTFIGGENTFLQPLQGVLETFSGTQWTSDTLVENQERQYRLRVENVTSGIYNWSLSDFTSYIRARHPQTSFTLTGVLSDYGSGKFFRGTFGSTLSPDESHKKLLEIENTGRSAVEIGYTLSGTLISYLLSPQSLGNAPIMLLDSQELQNPVKIIGNLQGVGNTHNINEKQNISNIESSQARNALRKNIEEHIKNRKGNDTLAGIKYIDKTQDVNKLYSLESNPDFETIIVRNGNIHIQNNFNTSGKKIGIISYIDNGYSVVNGYQSVGNIYVESEVETIRAFMYADGALVSTQLGIPVSSEATLRKGALDKQLFIYGSLFSRNTLAGGRELAGNYMLPGGQKSTDQLLAVQYDLYFTRRGNKDCQQDMYGFCNIPQYLILQYDTRISSSPPKLFSY